MFRCAAGHSTKEYQDRYLVVTKYREVENTHYITNSKGEKTIQSGVGTEIVEELPYCIDHFQAVIPKLIGHFEKNHYHYIPFYKDPEKESK